MVRSIGLCAISFVMFLVKGLFIPRMLLCFAVRARQRRDMKTCSERNVHVNGIVNRMMKIDFVHEHVNVNVNVYGREMKAC